MGKRIIRFFKNLVWLPPSSSWLHILRTDLNILVVFFFLFFALGCFFFYVLLLPDQFFGIPSNIFLDIKWITEFIINIKMIKTETRFATFLPAHTEINFSPCIQLTKLAKDTISWFSLHCPVLNITMWVLPQVPILNIFFIIKLRTLYFPWILNHSWPHCASCESLQSLLMLLLELTYLIIFSDWFCWLFVLEHPSMDICSCKMILPPKRFGIAFQELVASRIHSGS